MRDIAARLVHHLNERVRRGEISERRLARLTGYSQPHIHNVLKGARGMSLELADQVMELLGVPLISLLTQDELSGRASAPAADALPVPVLEGRLGGNKVFPRIEGSHERRFVPAVSLAGLVSPVLVVLDGRERSMWPMLWPDDLLLLDRSPSERRQPKLEHIYAISWKNKGCVARCRVVGRALLLVVDNARDAAKIPSTISLANRDILGIVRGKVVWLGRHLDSASPP